MNTTISSHLQGDQRLIDSDDREILKDFNDTDEFFDDSVTVHELFEAQVKHNRQKVAVRFKNETLTYQQLDIKANALAAYLRKAGVVPGQVVGIMCERSLEMVIGIFGIIKAGGAYMPISPHDPSNRINLLLEDSEIDILLVQHPIKEGLKFDKTLVCLEDFKNISTFDEPLGHVNKSTDLIYVIYTSGSTGMPKGVMVEHRSVVNRLKWMQRAYPISNGDVILQKTPFNFDVSVWEFFWWAIEGASMCLLPPNEEKHPLAIAEKVSTEKVTIIHFVPSMLGVFLDYIKDMELVNKIRSLRLIFASGERLSTKNVSQFNGILNTGRDTKLINLYGPTEATVDVTHYDCSLGEINGKIPIGTPISNTKIYIMDEQQKLVPFGEAGELVIAGVGVARGYLNRVDLTAAKFIDNSFAKHEKMYRTGDLARSLPGGNIEYINRIDNQIKVRGLRIELGEIEAILLKHDQIKNCIVNAIQYSESVTIIIAYYIAESEITSAELKKFLAEHLPDYMIPGKFIQIDNVPMTSNGKADRKALPDPFAVTL